MMEATKEYEIDKEKFIGRGSYSNVYMGRYIGRRDCVMEGEMNVPMENEEVAIKIIDNSKLTERSREVINDEVRIIRKIKKEPHPNIVRCYDVYEEEGKIYIVMEYCESGDLREILKKPIKEKYTQFYFSQLANGLKYLDEQNIMHRDIKPRNILLTNGKRELKIADFGFAKETKENSLYETICGSPLYMAPEMMRNRIYNRQTDLWSIGMILYEMLYGCHPYQKCRDIPELREYIEKEEIEIPPRRTANTEVSEECLELLRKLLQKEARDRITWEDFFEHTWLGVYKYMRPTTREKNKKYEELMQSVSLGSLPRRNIRADPKEINIPRLLNRRCLEDKVEIEVIENYIDSMRIKMESGEEEMGMEEENETYEIFEMELEDRVREIAVKSVMDRSSVLGREGESNYYKVIE